MHFKRLATILLAALLCVAPAAISTLAEAGNLLFANNASTTIASGISSTATSVTVAASTGSLFPSITTAGQHWRGTFVKNGNASLYEIVLVTATSGDTFTITRAQEGTTALAWSVGDYFNLFLTAADTREFAQFGDLQAQTGNYAVDSGTANAYSVTLSPALAGHALGMPIRVKFANTNTGTSTFNDGAGALALVTPDLGALQPGNIQGGGIGVVIYDGTRFELLGTYKLTFAQLGGQVGTSQVPLSAVAQYSPQLFSSPAFTGGPTAPTASPGNASTLLATTAFVQQAVTAIEPGGSLTQDGWTRLSNGLLLEWGLANPNGGTQQVNFSPAFSAIFVGLCTSTAVPTQCNVHSLTASSMQVSNTGGQAYWIATGD